MTIKFGNHRILCSRKKDHKDYLWNEIYTLRQGIIDDILESTRNDRHLDEAELKHKAMLIRKYSRRLKTMSF